MNVELVIAGLGWFVLAFGQAVVGLRWVLDAERIWRGRVGDPAPADAECPA